MRTKSWKQTDSNANITEIMRPNSLNVGKENKIWESRKFIR